MDTNGFDKGNSRYWDNYYSTSNAPLVPSQFAAFVASEIRQRSAVIDIGCGTGRDTFFFSNFGHVVIGIDRSETAIEKCNNRNPPTGGRCAFITSGIGEQDLLMKVEEKLGVSEMPRIIYSRFFLHAIQDEEEDNFFALCRGLLVGGGAIAVEFRTTRDRQLSKSTPEHYRRYINPLDLAARAKLHGFAIDYFIEGFGYAKFREDDAHVARLILSCGSRQNR